MTTLDIIAASYVPGTHSVFFLGCFDKRVTLYSQQVRALNLVAAILDQNMVRETGRVAIIGAGAAGITAAAALAKAAPNLKAIDVYDSEGEILHLQWTSRRYLHPHNYDWPTSNMDSEVAGLPLLNWTAGAANDVQTHLLQQFNQIRKGSSINLLLKSRVNSVIPYEFSQVGVEIEGRPEVSDYDAVIIAVGFGLERSAGTDTPAYWSSTGLEEKVIAPGFVDIFVSGNGDGGLVDFMTAAFNGLTHPQICHLLTAQNWGPALDKVKEIELAAWRDDAPLDIFEAYKNEVMPLVPPALFANIRDQLRDNARVILHTNEAHLFKRGTAILNRLGCALLLVTDEQYRRQRLSTIIGAEFEGNLPLSGPIRLAGHAPINPWKRFFRIGPDSVRNLEPFRKLIESLPPAAKMPPLGYRPATPGLTSGALARFGHLVAPAEPRGRKRQGQRPLSHVERVGKARVQPPTAPTPQAPAQIDPRVEHYLANLVDKFRYLPLQGLLDAQSLEIELEKVYIALRATDTDFEIEERLHAAEVSDRAKSRSFDAIPPNQVDDYDAQVIRTGFRPRKETANVADLHSVGRLFRTHRRLVILGGPGSGKSTLGRWIALQSARGLLNEFGAGKPTRVSAPRDQIDFAPPKGEAAEDLVDLGPARLPIFLPVAHYARELTQRKDAGEPAIGLLAYLGRDPDTAEIAESLTSEECNNCFKQMVEAGRAVIILDGLDELPDGDRRAIVPRIHEFINRFVPTGGPPPHEVGGNQILITSRYVGYSLAPVKAGCAHFGILPMGRTAVERFARSWGVAVNVEFARARARLFDAEGLIAEIYDSARPRLAALAANPLLVTILATVFYKEGHLPEQRAGVYHRVVENLLAIWLLRPECRNRLKRETLLAALEPLAADLQQNSMSGIVGIQQLSDIISPALEQMHGPGRPFQELREGLLKTIKDHVGLLAEQSGGNYAFFHRTFQEFLAARHLLANRKLAAARIRERLDDPLWREPLLLALEFAAIDWGLKAWTQLLTEVLEADDDGVLIPRAALTLVAALPDMPGVSPAVIKLTVDRLLASYERCLASGSSGRLQEEIHSAFRKLRAGSYASSVEAALLFHLQGSNYGSSVASLADRLDWRDQEIVGAMLDALPNDRQDLDWPIRRALARLLPNRAHAKSTDEPPLAVRIAARLPMRQRLLEDPGLVTWIRADPDWLRLIMALYGGIVETPHVRDTEGGLDGQDDNGSLNDEESSPFAFDPRSIVSDLHDPHLATLIGTALSERKPARSILSDLESTWERSDRKCDGEVLVAMAALGRDVVSILRRDLSSSSRASRAAAAIPRFAWLTRWIQPWLRRSGDVAIRTLPMSAPERERLDLMSLAIELLLSVGVEPETLAKSQWDDFAGPLSAGGRTRLRAERWACAMGGEVDAALAESLLNASAERVDLIDAWAGISSSGASRAQRSRQWSLPISPSSTAPICDRYEAMLASMTMLGPEAADFVAGSVMGKCFEMVCDDPEATWATAALLAHRGADFRAGFRVSTREVQITPLALEKLCAHLPEATLNAIRSLQSYTFPNGAAFVEAAERAVGEAAWSDFGAIILFWIAPGELGEREYPRCDHIAELAARTAFEDVDELPLEIFESRLILRPRKSSENRAAFQGPEIGSVVQLTDRTDAQLIAGAQTIGPGDHARLLLTLAHEEQGDRQRAVLAAGLSALEALVDENTRSDIISESRILWDHNVEAQDGLEGAASRIRDPWLRDRARGRYSQLVEAHHNAFESRPLVWRRKDALGKELCFRAGPRSGSLVWAAIYLTAVSREVAALEGLRTPMEEAWMKLLGPESADAVESLVLRGSQNGIKLGAREAWIIDHLVRQGRAAEIDQLWPLLEADAGAEAAIIRWIGEGGSAANWALLTQAEAGHLNRSTIGAALQFSQTSSDRLRFRAGIALHSRHPHLSASPRRWSVRRIGPEPLEMVARKAGEPGLKQATRSTLSLVRMDVRHDDVYAVERWIQQAGGGIDPTPAQWILGFVPFAEEHVLDTMLDAIPSSAPTVQVALLRGLCSAKYWLGNARLNGLDRFTAVPVSARMAEGVIQSGAAAVLRICVETMEHTDLQTRLKAARKLYTDSLVWLDDASLSDPDKAKKRLTEASKAGYIWYQQYWSEAATNAKAIKNAEDAVTFLLAWLDGERISAPTSMLADILTALETVASGVNAPVLAAVAEPDHWEPVLAEWAEFSPSWVGRMAAISLLGRLRWVTPRIVPAMVAALADIDFVQRAAFDAAGRFRAIHGDILPVVLPLLDESSTGVAATAARFLVAISQGDGEFVDRRLIFRCLQLTAARAPMRGVYLQDSPIEGPIGFRYVDRLDRVLNDAAFAVGGF